MADTIMEHVAHSLNVEPEEIRKKNLYEFNETTPYGMPVHVKLKARVPIGLYALSDIPRKQEIWAKCEESSEYHRRAKEIEEFNKSNKHRKKGLAIIPSKFGIAFTATFLNQVRTSFQYLS